MHIDFRLHFCFNEDGNINEDRLEIIKSSGRKILHQQWGDYSERAWTSEDFSRYFLDDFLYKVKEHFETVATYELEEE